MRRAWYLLSILCGILMILLGVMHSVFGWPQAQAGLAAVSTDEAFVKGFTIPWHFTGLGMAGFGFLCAQYYLAVLRGQVREPSAVRVAGVIFVAIGTWALIEVSPNPFFLSFILPGLIVLAGTLKPRVMAPS